MTAKPEINKLPIDEFLRLRIEQCENLTSAKLARIERLGMKISQPLPCMKILWFNTWLLKRVVKPGYSIMYEVFEAKKIVEFHRALIEKSQEAFLK